MENFTKGQIILARFIDDKDINTMPDCKTDKAVKRSNSVMTSLY